MIYGRLLLDVAVVAAASLLLLWVGGLAVRDFPRYLDCRAIISIDSRVASQFSGPIS